MHKDRLLKTALHLDTVVRNTPEKFDMGVWARKDHDCGTVCCAFGHACSIPEFQALGLILKLRGGGSTNPRLVPVLLDNPTNPCPPNGIYAAERFYGITMDEAEYLFTPERYEAEDRQRGDVTLDAVVNRLRHFAETREVTTFVDDQEDDWESGDDDEEDDSDE